MSSSSDTLASLEPDDDVVREIDLSEPETQPSLSWWCRFAPCTKLRVHEGGSRFCLGQLECCSTCGSSVVVDSKHLQAIIAVVSQHLL